MFVANPVFAGIIILVLVELLVEELMLVGRGFSLSQVGNKQ